jgi:putative transposase
MARQRKLSPECKEFLQKLLRAYQPEDAQDVQNMLKDLCGDTLQTMLETEMDEHLGYSKYDYKNKDTDDSRNGYSKKTVTSTMGNIPLDIPRDRKGAFHPQAVKKNQTDVSNIEDQVLSMYAKGMTTRDITAHLKEIYGVDSSAEMISRMTDRILPIAKEWQNRPLAKKYAIVFMDTVHFHVRQDSGSKESGLCCHWNPSRWFPRGPWALDWRQRKCKILDWRPERNQEPRNRRYLYFFC